MLRLSYLTAYLYIVFSSFYLSKIIFSPIYILTFIGFICFLGYLLFKNKFIFCFPTFFILLLIIVTSISQYFLAGQTNVVLGFLFSLHIYIVLLNVLDNISKENIFKLLRKMFHFSTFLFFVDTLYRFANPLIKENDIWFYKYKYNSIMYLDSNFVGLNILILLCLYQYLRIEHHYKKQKTTYWILVILLVLTMSRASIITYGLVLAFLHTKRRYWIFGILPISILIWNKIANDPSFLTKFDLWSRFFNFLSHSTSNQLLFGVGLGDAKKVLGMGSHNIFITYAVETGLVILFILFLLWTNLLIKSKNKILYILLPLLINGLSLTTTNTSYFYMSAAVIVVFSRKAE